MSCEARSPQTGIDYRMGDAGALNTSQTPSPRGLQLRHAAQVGLSPCPGGGCSRRDVAGIAQRARSYRDTVSGLSPLMDGPSVMWPVVNAPTNRRF